jgi:hypothetical protein
MKNIWILGFMAMVSCSPPLYLPNTVQSPTLLEQGEVEIGTYWANDNLNVQAAGAVTDNIGILASVATDFNSMSDSAYHHFGEIGVGYTHNWADIENRSKVAPLVMGFLGYGAGVVRGENESGVSDDGTFTSYGWGAYDRLFLQLGGGITQKHFELLINLRTTYVTFQKLETNFGEQRGTDRENVFLEPTLTLKVGGERLKLFGQFGLAYSTKEMNQVAFRHEPLMLSLGINYQFNFKK